MQVPASAPDRPALRYHGGKFMLAPWIISHFPAHDIYTEVFGGAASVLLRKPKVYAEIYNDLDDELVDYFRILRDPVQAAEFRRLLEATPYSRTEFELAYKRGRTKMERVRRLLVRSFQGHGSNGHNARVKTGWRIATSKSGTSPQTDWAGFPSLIPIFSERMLSVGIEKRPALDVLRKHDGPRTLHYVDPPYMPATRSDKSRKSGEKYHAYKHEMTTEQHVELLECLLDLEGMVVLSGYPHETYDKMLAGWSRFEKAARADGGRLRREVIWLNPAAAERRPTPCLLEALASN